MNPPESADDRLHAALSRLQTTRLALRSELLDEEDTPPGGAAGSDSAASQQAPGFRWWRRLRRSARRSPLLNLATQSAVKWWQQQPWHEGTRQLSREILAQARPVVRKYPLAAVATAAAVGAVVVACRPWRWALVADPLRAMPGHARHWALQQLASAPVQAALLAMLLGSLRANPEDADPAADRAVADRPARAGAAPGKPEPA